MLVTPSPLLVLHCKHPYFDEQIYHMEYALGTNAAELYDPSKSQLFTDLSFLCLNEDNPNAQKSALRASMFLALFADIETPDIPLFLGILALSTSDSQTARHWLMISASKGNKNAMVLLGRLHQGYFNTAPLPESDDRPILRAIRWYVRAIRSGSVEALYYLGELYFNTKDYPHALLYFNQYFKKTKSALAAKFIADALYLTNNRQLSIKWHRYAASRGVQGSVNALIVDKRENWDLTAFLQWYSMASRLNVFVDQKYYFSPLLRANLTERVEIPSVQNASILLSISEKYSEAGRMKEAKPSIELQNITTGHNFVNICKGETTGLHALPKIIPSPSPVPAISPTQMLIKAFKLASPSFDSRNLMLCKSVLQHLQIPKPRGICESQLFRAKCKSFNPDDLVTCAFISLVLNDVVYALELFGKAAMAGSETANLMLGLILFHGIGSTERLESGVVYLSRCPLDPIALVHLGVIYNDETWLKRAAQFLNLPYTDYRIYEWVGDLFADGIKLPQDNKVAMMWYGIALTKAEENGADQTALLQKVGQHAYNSRSSFR